MASRAWPVLKRTVVGFYDDQGTHHAAALTYYGLMSLFPTALLGVALLGLLGQYPETYNAILSYLREVVPASTLQALDASIRGALRSKGTALTALLIGAATALYGSTGALEAARRAFNVAHEVEGGRGFVRRKLTDIGSTLVLMSLVLVTLILMFVGRDFAADLFGFVGVGETAAEVWALARWPAALVVALFVFAWVYYVTPDVKYRSWKLITPGAVVGVSIWLLASAGFSYYVNNFGTVNATYGSFAAAIVLLVWLWLSNVALLFGAELNAEIEREREMRLGIPRSQTLQMQERG